MTMSSLEIDSFHGPDTVPQTSERSSRKVMKKAVRFALEPEIAGPCSPQPELTEEDVQELWYTKDEYRLIKKSYCFIIRMMDRKECIDDDEMCSRGLETRTRAGAKRRRQIIEASLDAVLGEQECQWEEGYYSARDIAEAYREVSAESSMSAYIQAQRDVRAIRGETQSTSAKPLPTKAASLRPLTSTEKLHRQSSQSSVRSK